MDKITPKVVMRGLLDTGGFKPYVYQKYGNWTGISWEIMQRLEQVTKEFRIQVMGLTFTGIRISLKWQNLLSVCA